MLKPALFFVGLAEPGVRVGVRPTCIFLALLTGVDVTDRAAAAAAEDGVFWGACAFFLFLAARSVASFSTSPSSEGARWRFLLGSPWGTPGSTLVGDGSLFSLFG
jgi:hypothetical protein